MTSTDLGNVFCKVDSRSFLVISHCPEGALNSQNFADIIKDMGLNMDYLLTVSIRDVWTRKQKAETQDNRETTVNFYLWQLQNLG